MSTVVVIRTAFSAMHCWPDCPIEEVEYLRHLHRHVFHVEMKWLVNHNDRDIEFIQMKNQVNRHLQNHYEAQNLGRMSCEQIAQTLSKEFGACFVSVFEDGENGAEVSL